VETILKKWCRKKFPRIFIFPSLPPPHPPPQVDCWAIVKSGEEEREARIHQDKQTKSKDFRR